MYQGCRAMVHAPTYNGNFTKQCRNVEWELIMGPRFTQNAWSNGMVAGENWCIHNLATHPYSSLDQLMAQVFGRNFVKEKTMQKGRVM